MCAHFRRLVWLHKAKGFGKHPAPAAPTRTTVLPCDQRSCPCCAPPKKQALVLKTSLIPLLRPALSTLGLGVQPGVGLQGVAPRGPRGTASSSAAQQLQA